MSGRWRVGAWWPRPPSVILIVRKERGGETSVLLAGRANDERQAYLQLRAYATVGQAMMGLFVVLFAIDLLRGTSGPWGWLVAVCGMIGAGTLFVLRQREQYAGARPPAS